MFQIKWPKSEGKTNFGGRWFWVSESVPQALIQNFMAMPSLTVLINYMQIAIVIFLNICKNDH